MILPRMVALVLFANHSKGFIEFRFCLLRVARLQEFIELLRER